MVQRFRYTGGGDASIPYRWSDRLVSDSTSPLVQSADDSFSIRAILAPLAAIVLGTFMAILDSTVVNVALPTLSRVFDADLRLMQWVITGYTLAQAAVVPLAGWLSDRFGAKRVYLASLVLFTLGSVLCALSPSGGFLVFFRVLQGLGGGMLMPVGMAFLYRLAPPARRGAVMGAFGVPVLLGPALGPVLSGWLVEFADWRLIFLINVPIGVAAVVLGQRVLPWLQAQRASGRLDLLGAILGPLAFASLTFGIGESYGAGWTAPTTLAGLAIGVLTLAAFIRHELVTPDPLLDLRVFRVAAFTRAVSTQWLIMLTFGGMFLLLPLFFQQVLGYGPFQTGLALLPQALVAAAFMPIGGRLFDRWGARPTVSIGLGLVALSCLLLSLLTPESTALSMLPALAIWGAGLGLAMMPLGTHILNVAPRDLVSRVTALSGALQGVMISLSVAGAATIYQARTEVHAVSHGPGAMALALASDDTFRLSAAIAVVSVGFALTLRRPRAPDATESAPVAAHASPAHVGA